MIKSKKTKLGFQIYLRFFLQAFFFPPVARLLCMESREIPINPYKLHKLAPKNWNPKSKIEKRFEKLE